MHPVVSQTTNKDSFTLVELLVVIGILAILTAAVLIIINPSEYLKSSRDATRMSDLSSINKALSVLETQGTTSFGTANRVYISIADDASSTCGSLSLPTLPTNWLYQCVSTSNLQKTDGTGWIPVNFSSAPSLSFSNLPIDPINSTTTREYYSYVTGGSWHLSASLQSTKYKLGGSSDRTSTDGGKYTGLYEIGSNKTLLPIDYGDSSLVGYWNFDEGSGSYAYDYSGNNNTGTLTNGPTWAAGKISNSILLDGENDYINYTYRSSIGPDAFTLTGWVNFNNTTTTYQPLVSWGTTYPSINYRYATPAPLTYLNSTNYRYFNITGVTPYDSQWHFVAYTVVGNSQNDILNSEFYLDGVKRASGSTSNASSQVAKSIFRIGSSGSSRFYGKLDEFRLYNRVLSQSEVQALYSLTK